MVLRDAPELEVVRSSVVTRGEAVGVDGLASRAGEAAEGDSLVLNPAAAWEKFDP